LVDKLPAALLREKERELGAAIGRFLHLRTLAHGLIELWVACSRRR